MGKKRASAAAAGAAVEGGRPAGMALNVAHWRSDQKASLSGVASGRVAAPATSASSAAGRRAIATVCSIGSGRGQAHGWGAGSTAAAPASACTVQHAQPEPSTAVVPAQKRMMRTSGRSSCGQAEKDRGGEWGVSGCQQHESCYIVLPTPCGHLVQQLRSCRPLRGAQNQHGHAPALSCKARQGRLQRSSPRGRRRGTGRRCGRWSCSTCERAAHTGGGREGTFCRHKSQLAAERRGF